MCTCECVLWGVRSVEARAISAEQRALKAEEALQEALEKIQELERQIPKNPTPEPEGEQNTFISTP